MISTTEVVMRSSEAFAPNGRSYGEVVGEYESELASLRWRLAGATQRAAGWRLVALVAVMAAALTWLA